PLNSRAKSSSGTTQLFTLMSSKLWRAIQCEPILAYRGVAQRKWSFSEPRHEMPVQSVKPTNFCAVRTGIFVVVAMLVVLAVFGEALSELARRWIAQEEYSHGFLVPVVAAWLLWSRRTALASNIGQPSYSGLVLILIAAMLRIAGDLSATFILSQVGFIIALM